ncbi:IS5 family transposase [Pilimelia anulata]|uniref:IS5 family transposase n=1 Tax=Pilimelia anulata TaxID=53371 RepID=UPI003570E872
MSLGVVPASTERWGVAAVGFWIFDAVALAELDDDIDWHVQVDATIVRTHQHAAGAAKRGSRSPKRRHVKLGRSRGGLTTKIPTLADGRGRSLASLLTPGQAADTRQLIPLLGQVRAPRPTGVGRPRQRPESVTGDKAYSSRANRQHRRDKHVRAVIPEPNDQTANRKRHGRLGGRPPKFDQAPYRRRNQVERGFNRRKHWRGLATRDGKLAAHYQATLDLAEMLDWLRTVPDGHDPRDRTSTAPRVANCLLADKRLRSMAARCNSHLVARSNWYPSIRPRQSTDCLKFLANRNRRLSPNFQEAKSCECRIGTPPLPHWHPVPL